MKKNLQIKYLILFMIAPFLLQAQIDPGSVSIQKVFKCKVYQEKEISSEWSDWGAVYWDKGIIVNRFKDTDEDFQEYLVHHLDEESVILAGYEYDYKTREYREIPFDTRGLHGYLIFSESFSKDMKTGYFTFARVLEERRKKRKTTNRRVVLGIFKAEYLPVSGWYNIQEIPFNSEEYHVAYPALSPDEKTLYFASDMPGTFGNSDIFKVEILSNGQFGTPVNLGSKINTSGRESFPFVSGKNTLFFSSDGHSGQGGLDIFSFDLASGSDQAHVINLGSQVNSTEDDYAFIVDSNHEVGFFASKREGMESDDIHKVIWEVDYVNLSGTIYSENKTPLANTEVVLYDKEFNEIARTHTNSEGYYFIEGVDSSKLLFSLSVKKGHEALTIIFNDVTAMGKDALHHTLKEIEVNLADDLLKIFNRNPVFFDFGKWEINRNDAESLMAVLEVMKLYPEMVVEVRAHTDNIGSHQFNMKLSQLRAEEVVQWLVSKGISVHRLQAVGKGKTEPLYDCKEDCSEEEHRQNRRAEFIIVKK